MWRRPNSRLDVHSHRRWSPIEEHSQPAGNPPPEDRLCQELFPTRFDHQILIDRKLPAVPGSLKLADRRRNRTSFVRPLRQNAELFRTRGSTRRPNARHPISVIRFLGIHEPTQEFRFFHIPPNVKYCVYTKSFQIILDPSATVKLFQLLSLN